MENHDAELRKMGEAFEEVSRQLAAANERAGRLEKERDELQQRINRASEKALLLAQKILGGA